MCVYNERVGIIPVIISQWRDTLLMPRDRLAVCHFITGTRYTLSVPTLSLGTSLW